jgi:hypothetical protein
MRANEEVRQRRQLRSAPAPIGEERLAGEKGGFVGNRFAVKRGFRQGGVERLDARKSNREFAIDDWVDDEAIAVGGALERLDRPGEPALVFREDVEKNVGVDEDGGPSVIAGQGHDFVRRHCDIAASPQMTDKPSAATIVLAGFGANDAHGLAVELEFHFGLRQQTGLLADVDRNGHLAFGCDAQQYLRTVTGRSKRAPGGLQCRGLGANT